MKLGLIGLPLAGKSTLFRLLTGAAPPEGGGTKGAVGIARVPIPGGHPGRALQSPQGHLRDDDGDGGAGADPISLSKPCRGPFRLDPKALSTRSRTWTRSSTSCEPFTIRDAPRARRDRSGPGSNSHRATTVALADWQLIETRLERLQAAKKRQPDHELQLATLNKAQAALEQETPLFAVDFDEQERRALKGYTLFTDKPALVAVNLDDQQLAQGDYPQKEGLASAAVPWARPWSSLPLWWKARSPNWILRTARLSWTTWG